MNPVIDLYLRFEHKPESKGKSRFDLVSSSANYEAFIPSKTGATWCYLSDCLDNISAHGSRKGNLRISNGRGNHLSSIFLPSVEHPNIGYCDYADDAILVNLTGNELELFISRGRKHHLHGLFDLFIDGQLDEEIEYLKQLAEAKC